MKKFKAIAAALLAVALATGSVTVSTAAGKTLTLGSILKPVSFAADQAQYGNSVWFFQAVYDTLLRKKEDGTLIPGIATKWSYNSDKTVLTLTLRSGVKFTDGAVLDADAVVKNLVANRDSNGPQANYLQSMKTAVAKDASTVVITLTQIDPSFLEYLADTAGLLASPNAIGKASSDTVPVGSGPYTLDKDNSVAGATYTYVANPTYWDKANRAYDSLVIKIFAETTAMNNALKSGAIQGGNIAPNLVAPLKAAGYKSASYYLDVKGIYFGKRNAASKSCIADVNVRRAINTVLDRAAMLKAFDSGLGKPTTQYIPNYNKGYNAALEKKYAFSEKDAKALMAKSKFPKGCTITMGTFTPAFGEPIYAVIKAQFKKIGITVKEVADTDAGVFLGNLASTRFDAYLMAFERSGNPWTLINFMISKDAAFNNDKYSERKVATLIARYPSANDADRIKILKDLNLELVNNAWFAPLYALQSNFMYKGITIKSAQAGNVIPFLYNIK